MYRNLKNMKGLKIDISQKSKVGYVIMAVLGVFCFFGLPVIVLLFAINPAKQIAKARQAQSINNMKSIQFAVEEYFADNNESPTSMKLLVPNYLKSLPNNPDDKMCYKVDFNKITSEVIVTESEKIGSVCDLKVSIN